jgi:cell wall-associated NlpC family hydrolase
MHWYSFGKKLVIFIYLILFFSKIFAVEVPIYDFSIKAYPQNTNDYLPRDSKDYSRPLLKPEYQASQLQQFYNYYYASDAKGLSPWSEQMVKSVLPIVKKVEMEILNDFDNQNKEASNRHFAENFKEHDEVWWSAVNQNMNLSAIDASEFSENNKAIAITNTFARALPVDAPDFFHFSLAGQGFPFDNLQESTIWAGTPLYVISLSKDMGWALVLTPDAYFAWVKNSDIAFVSNDFISQWQLAAKKGLVAITKTNIPIVDKHNQFQFSGYIGAVFPLAEGHSTDLSLLIPVKNSHHHAVIKVGRVNNKAAALMPVTASKKNIVKIIKQLQNRPYGWGGAFFFNDCSQELKSIFTPFGIWLPRNSAQQAQFDSTLDLSKNTIDERIGILKEKGHPLLTIIYIGGHVMLYVGNKDMPNHEREAVTYQNVWGLSPASGDKRYVIGQSLFFPLLKSYPETPDVNSLAGRSFFKLVYLDELEGKNPSLEAFTWYFTKALPAVNL